MSGQLPERALEIEPDAPPAAGPNVAEGVAASVEERLPGRSGRPAGEPTWATGGHDG